MSVSYGVRSLFFNVHFDFLLVKRWMLDIGNRLNGILQSKKPSENRMAKSEMCKNSVAQTTWRLIITAAAA